MSSKFVRLLSLILLTELLIPGNYQSLLRKRQPWWCLGILQQIIKGWHKNKLVPKIRAPSLGFCKNLLIFIFNFRYLMFFSLLNVCSINWLTVTIKLSWEQAWGTGSLFQIPAVGYFQRLFTFSESQEIIKSCQGEDNVLCKSTFQLPEQKKIPMESRTCWLLNQCWGSHCRDHVAQCHNWS